MKRIGGWLAVALLAGTAAAWAAQAQPALGAEKAAATDSAAALRAKYPLEVKLDYSEVPEMKDWAEKAKALVEQWYPFMCEALASDGFTPPKKLNLIFKKSDQGIASTSGGTITCSDGWFKAHPKDFGAVIHESIHVIQSYPGGSPSWLVEGIDDYMRFWFFEPETPKARLDPAKIKYTDSYQTTAAFLAWTVKTYDKDLVRKLNAACRNRKYKDDLFKEATGKDLNALFEEFKTSLAKK
jgi:hypothetical protein